MLFYTKISRMTSDSHTDGKKPTFMELPSIEVQHKLSTVEFLLQC